MACPNDVSACSTVPPSCSAVFARSANRRSAAFASTQMDAEKRRTASASSRSCLISSARSSVCGECWRFSTNRRSAASNRPRRGWVGSSRISTRVRSMEVTIFWKIFSSTDAGIHHFDSCCTRARIRS